MLTDGILDQLAKYERAKVAKRTHPSLLQKAREGKVIRVPKANYGFKYNDTEDGLLMHQPEMRIVEKIFRMAASGIGRKAMQTRLYAEARSWTWAGSYLSLLIGTVYHHSTQECGAREVLPLFSIVCLQSTSLLAQ
jgi:DNA invertase Pin-like site-specific DNA recombinase